MAIGGGERLGPEARVEDLLLELAGGARPRVCFVPTAKAHEPEHVDEFYAAFADRGCEPSHLELFGIPEEPAVHVAAQDVVYVGGGNTANLLALWRVHGIDGALRAAWERGAVLAGWSAGANCWFEACTTDSFGAIAPLTDGLGLLAGSFCPHYDAEPERRPTFIRLVSAGFPAGYAADDGVALHFRGTELREAVAAPAGGAAYRVRPDGEAALAVRRLEPVG